MTCRDSRLLHLFDGGLREGRRRGRDVDGLVEVERVGRERARAERDADRLLHDGDGERAVGNALGASCECIPQRSAQQSMQTPLAMKECIRFLALPCFLDSGSDMCFSVAGAAQGARRLEADQPVHLQVRGPLAALDLDGVLALDVRLHARAPVELARAGRRGDAAAGDGVWPARADAAAPGDGAGDLDIAARTAREQRVFNWNRPPARQSNRHSPPATPYPSFLEFKLNTWRSLHIDH
eukprot:gene1577-biopygen1388